MNISGNNLRHFLKYARSYSGLPLSLKMYKYSRKLGAGVAIYKGSCTHGSDTPTVAQESKKAKGLLSTDCNKCCAPREINPVKVKEQWGGTRLDRIRGKYSLRIFERC